MNRAPFSELWRNALKSNSIEMIRLCLIIATWLTHMLLILPDTGVKSAACKSFLDEFMNVLQSSKNVEEKSERSSIINDPDMSSLESNFML